MVVLTNCGQYVLRSGVAFIFGQNRSGVQV